MMGLLPSVLILGMAVIAAALLTRQRSSPPQQLAARRLAAHTLALATTLQSVHFVEEAITGFHAAFPMMMGLPPMPFWFFMLFNLAWIAAWFTAVTALPAGRSWAFFVAWFLAIAGGLNLVAHPILAVISGAYFPGLLSSPFVGIACILLGRRLVTATQSQAI